MKPAATFAPQRDETGSLRRPLMMRIIMERRGGRDIVDEGNMCSLFPMRRCRRLLLLLFCCCSDYGTNKVASGAFELPIVGVLCGELS
ncbi:MAG: hypothetical protein MHMPM18_001197 [Marteilia pararefringens]